MVSFEKGKRYRFSLEKYLKDPKSKIYNKKNELKRVDGKEVIAMGNWTAIVFTGDELEWLSLDVDWCEDIEIDKSIDKNINKIIGIITCSFLENQDKKELIDFMMLLENRVKGCYYNGEK